jgi:acetylglutamate kinase
MLPVTSASDTGPDQRTLAAASGATKATPFVAVLNGLNHLRLWRDRTVVIKYGGAAMGQAELRASFARDVARLHAAGVHPVVVHGGGPQIDGLLRRVGKTPRFVGGLRVTDEETMALVEMVLVGQVNPEIVGLINQHGGLAMGLNGKDANLIVAHRRRPHRLAGGECVDLGCVGDVDAVDPRPLRLLDEHGVVPVIAPIATGRDGATYNVNADHVAGAVAAALGAAVLVQMTDVPGILDRDGHALPIISRRGLDRLVRDGVVNDGMLPKVDAAVSALEGGANRVRIVDGRHPHALVRALLGSRGTGTEVVL